MPEPPVSPKLKELVLKHEQHAKESSKLDTQPRQKPRAKFRDSFILDTKDEGLYSTLQENGFSDSNSIMLHSVKHSGGDQKNETIVKCKSQPTVFQPKSVLRSDESRNISVTQDSLQSEVSSVNDQEPLGKLTGEHRTYHSSDDSDAKRDTAKVNAVTTSIGGKNAGPGITDIPKEYNDLDRVDGNKVVKRNRSNGKFESIQKRFSLESFDQDSRRSSKEINGYEITEESPQSSRKSSLVRGESIKALQHKFQQATVTSSQKPKSDSSCNNERQIEEKIEIADTNTPNSNSPSSFLDNSSKVTDVHDVLTRMREADLIVENGDTEEDVEARTLLNKFLGASVILHGIEQGAATLNSSHKTTKKTTTSSSHVKPVEKKRAQKSPTITKNLRELDNIWDERQLRILLESCQDHDQRKKIRARLRQIMAEQKACADVVSSVNTNSSAATSNGTNGELKPSVCCSLNLKPNPPVVDDSGTESGEEVNQKILVQVQGALANLESALPALDPLRRSSVIELLTKLQTSLKLSSSSAADCSSGKPTPPPRKCWNKKAAARQDRHTVGVSSEELQDARRWLEENGYADVAPSQAAKKPVSACSTPRSYDVSCTGSASKQFRPVKFVPPPPKRTHYAEDYIPEPSKQQLQNNSFACAPLQHVQVVENVDKIRTTASSRGSTDSSGDVSDDGDRDGDRRSVSSAQRLLQIASNDHGRKFRQGKRVKLKRPSGPDHTTEEEEEEEEEEQSSGDEYRRVGRKGSINSGAGGNVGGAGGGMPPFEPKTASDQKYLALLRQAKDDETAAPPVYNSLHGKLQGNWGNRFGRIKTTFERGGAACASLAGSPKKNLAKTFWHDICKCPSDDSIGYRSKKVTSFKPVWSGENGFSHATKSAFRPVAQKAAAFLEPKKRVQPGGGPSAQPPKHLQLPLYNSAVTTAHRPFICSDGKTAARPAEDGGRFGKTASQPWNQLPSPCSGTSDLTSRSASPSADFSDAPQPCVTSRVMGSPQTASIVKGKTAGHHRSPLHPSAPTQPPPPPVASVQAPRPPPRSPRLVRQQRSPTSSPVRMPSVLQKSESWHQMIMGQSKAAARTPLAPPSPQPARHVPQAVRPFEGYVPCKDEIARKQNIVRQHLRAAAEGGGGRGVQVSKSVSPKLVRLNDDIDKVDDTFENLFKEATRAK